MRNIFDRLVSEGNDDAATELLNTQPSTNGMAEGNASEDSFRTSTEVKEATQELLKYGYLEEAQRSSLFRNVIVHEREIMAALEPLDLVLRLDTHRGIAYLAVAQAVEGSVNLDAGWTHPLVRRQRLTLEQSLLVALLRQAFVMHEQESGVGQSAATIAVDDLLPQFLAYLGDSGSDGKNESRLLNLLDQLKSYGIVSEVDKKQEVTIRPLIAHLADPESLAALLSVLKKQSCLADSGEHEA